MHSLRRYLGSLLYFLVPGHIPNEYYLIWLDNAEGFQYFYDGLLSGLRHFIMDLPAGRCMVNVLSDVVVLDSILGEIAEITHIMYSLHNILLSSVMFPRSG